MLKKLLYNKYKLNNIPESFPYSSEEFFKMLYDKKNCIFFKYKEEFRLLGYNGEVPDFLGRATKFQPLAIVGTENYKLLNKDEVVKYEENSLRGVGSSYSYISEDIDRYIELLNAIDKSVLVNSKQVLIPFFIKSTSTKSGELLKKMLKNIFGEDFQNLIIETKITDNANGTLIESTSMQVFLEQLQNAKKKILDEAFLYLGVGAPAGKLAHESVQETEQNEKVTDLLDNVVFLKFNDFVIEINKKFNLEMSISKNF